MSGEMTYHLAAVALSVYRLGLESWPVLALACLMAAAWLLACLASTATAACTNEDLRGGASAGLPDCRAYEQATPVAKNGQDATGTYQTVKASPDGDAVSFSTVNGTPAPPNAGTQDTPLYLASRSSGGWSTQGIMPDQSAGQNAKVLGWLPDFAQVFSRAIVLGTPPVASFLSRSSADGSLATIVPPTAGLEGGNGLAFGLAYAGANPGGSQVFFEAVGAELTPKAAVDKPNLYLWNAASKTLSLVGILPDGSTPPGGSFAGPYDWVKGASVASAISGGASQNYYLGEQRAISTDASRVYFTAGGTGQLYVRENPAAAETTQHDGKGNCIPDPVLACTIQLSASRKTNGGKGGRDVAGTQPAAFMAASANGSTAFFTSTEKLTNDATTGTEPPPPAIARANLSDGSGKNLSFLPASALGVDTDATHIYWADPRKDAIGRAKLNGTNPASEIEDEYITGADNPQDVAVNSEHIYWTNAAAKGEGEGSIGRAKLGATAEEVNQDFIVDEVIEINPGEFGHTINDPRGIDVDAAHIYWGNRVYLDVQHTKTNTVARANLDGTGVVEPKFINIGGGDVAVNASKIYYSVPGVIRYVNLDGKSESEFLFSFPGTEEPPSLALDASHLYWTSNGEGRVGRSNLDGSSPEEGFITQAGHPQGLAVDGSQIYWSADQETLPNPGNDLYRYDVGGNTLEDITVDTSDLNGAEVQGIAGASEDGSYLYFVANGEPDEYDGEPNPKGESPAAGNCKGIGSQTGTCNLYLWHEGSIGFVAQLSLGGADKTDAADWAPTATGVFQDPRFQKTSRVSADGQTLLFRSQRKLTTYDNKGKPELYLYRAKEESLLCVSCLPSGAPPLSTLPVSVQNPVLIPLNPAANLSRSLSTDGQRVFFESTDALVGADKDGEAGCPTVGSEKQHYPACQDVYEWEANGSGTCESEAENGGCLYLISDGKGPEPSLFADASADGGDVFFFTRSALVRQDQDELMDLYDASAGGGIAAQNALTPVPCEGEACKPGTIPPPAYQSPGSASFIGPPNPKPNRHKKKPRHKKHHHKRPQRNAKSSGRAGR